MKKIENVINTLVASMETNSINQIPELNYFSNYAELKSMHEKKEITFGYQFQESIIDNFGSTFEILLDKVLLSSPIIMILLSVLFAYTKSQLYFLIGVPLSILGIFLTTPSIIKSGSSLMGIICLTLLITGIQISFNNFELGFLFLSFSIPNFLLTVNRQLKMQVFERAILYSEIIFCYYFLRGECYLIRKIDQRLFQKRS